MNSIPLVSVLVRTRNRQALLQQALDSVHAQQWPAIEIVIVNDGGDDFSPDFTSEHDNVHWLNNSGPHGRSHAANIAMDNATGEYCLFLDDDDLLDPMHIQLLISALKENDNYQLAYSAVRVLSDGQEEETPSFNHPFDAVRLMIENYIPIHAVLFKRSLLEEGFRFDPAFDRFEDWDFWLQISQRHEFLFVNECSAVYRVDSISGFGAKENPDQNMNAYRSALYRKWFPIWPDEKLLALMDRSREFPRIGVLEKGIEELNSQLKHLDNLQEILKKTLKERDSRIIEQQANIIEQQTNLKINRKELEESEGRLRQLTKHNASLQEEIQIIYNSKSWRITKPLRFATRLRWFMKNEGLAAILSRLKERLKARKSSLANIHQEFPVSKNIGPLNFPEFDHPEVSIVIPVHNKYEFTFHCLQSILKHAGSTPFEVIVVDDLSQDKTEKMLRQISGITIIRNSENLGFIGSCNIGAESARGKFLVLLNNDTEVRDGWLDALQQTFTDFPDAGMVGARLVFGDGSLQEAGGIVWRDGSAWNYGRGDDPNKPEYTYCRQVDYCSGACLMIPLEDFRSFGGFDTHYTPAYYEDTDLAFKVRENGKRVYYQPNATVIHFEGITSGTDTSSGTKKYQDINVNKFFSRWEETLKSHRPNARFPHLEKERHVDKRILVVDARVLMSDHDSGSLRMLNILKILQRIGYKVTFVPANLQYHEKYTPQLQAIGIECQYVPYVKSVSKYLEDYGQQFDAVILSRADYAEKYIDEVKQFCPQARIIFDTVDLHFLREQREADITGDQSLAESAVWRKNQELTIARKADVTLVVSPVEIDLFQEEAPDIPVQLLSNIHENHETANNFQNRKDILFIGNFEHPPNTDAMTFFLDDIFPIVMERNPDITMHIVGGHVPSILTNRASDRVRFTGFVSNIDDCFNNIRLSVAPLRYGAGVKGKVNSSMSYGVPMVVTEMAAEGMNLVHNEDILIADSPEDFANEVLRLYGDEDLWQKLSEAGKRNIEAHFSFAAAEKQLRAVLES